VVLTQMMKKCLLFIFLSVFGLSTAYYQKYSGTFIKDLDSQLIRNFF
jgi:hypothetical protein